MDPIPPCDSYYDMKYNVEYSTFHNFQNGNCVHCDGVLTCKINSLALSKISSFGQCDIIVPLLILSIA